LEIVRFLLEDGRMSPHREAIREASKNGYLEI